MFWKGDHPPRHVHVYNDNGLVLKWNLEANKVISGKVNKKLQKLIEELVDEGKL